MNETKKSRKEWVKTAAIVFLSVMLVLTFFSNSIMNYSLPEVATQYIEPGSITAQIRGNGTVESGDPYKVKISGIRKVESIDVYVGDVVDKGTVLMHLSYEDSDALKAAKAELEAAELNYEMALLTGEVDAGIMKSAGSALSTEAYKNQIISLKNEIALAEKEVKAAQVKVDELTRWGDALSTQISITPTNTADVSKETKALEEIKDKLENTKIEKRKLENKRDALERKIGDPSVSGNEAEVTVLLSQKADIERQINEKETECDSLEIEVDTAEKILNDKFASGDTSGTIANLTSQKNSNDSNLFHAKNELIDKEKILAEKEEALNDYVKNTSDALNLSSKYQVVVDARKKVADMEEEMAGGDVTAPIAGTITAINVTSGLDTPEDGVVVTMQPEGEGYTMSISVTNEQARKVTVGEQASLVNAWRYDDLKVTLTKIMPDKTDPSQKKLLVFDVAGDNVIAGQSLNISIGQKSANYDMIVPNSAIREDNNGKFILIVESKNSHLGNRYIATRVDVEVIASDDTKSAITGAVYGYEFVITTSTKPIQAGQYVRLSDN
jgi:hypothetical protein